MKNVRIAKIIKSFTIEELKKIHAWLENELVGRQPAMFRLFLALEKACETNSWDQEFIWSTIFDNAPFNKSQLRRLAEQLIQWLEEYIAIEAFRKDRMRRDYFLIQGLNQRKQIELFPFFFKKIKNRWERKAQRDAEYYQLMFGLENELLFYESLDTAKKIKSKGQTQLRYNQSFESWMILLRLQTSLLLKNHKKVFANPIVPLLEKEAIELVREDERLKQMPAVRFSVNLIDFLEGTLENSETFFEEIEASKDLFGEQTYVSFFHIAFNKIIIQANKTGDKKYYVQLLELYDWGIESKIFFDGDYLHISHYKNIVTIAQKLALLSDNKEIKDAYMLRTQNYLESLKQYLPLSEREEAYIVYKAIYHFANEEYQEVRMAMARKKFLNVFYEIQGRMVVIKARYELKEQADLEREIKSFRAFLNGQKNLDMQHKAPYLKRLKFLMKLVKAGPNTDSTKLKDQIRNAPILNDRKWLLDKASELNS